MKVCEEQVNSLQWLIGLLLACLQATLPHCLNWALIALIVCLQLELVFYIFYSCWFQDSLINWEF